MQMLPKRSNTNNHECTSENKEHAQSRIIRDVQRVHRLHATNNFRFI